MEQYHTTEVTDIWLHFFIRWSTSPKPLQFISVTVLQKSNERSIIRFMLLSLHVKVYDNLNESI